MQRSVANNINDIGKDHPNIAASLCRRWLDGAPPGRQWIVRHALRSLVKKGIAARSTPLGFGAAPSVAIASASLSPRSVKLGGELRFSFELTSTAGDQQLVVDCAVHFVKANGSTRAKVFKLRKLVLPPVGSSRDRRQGLLRGDDDAPSLPRSPQHRCDGQRRGAPAGAIRGVPVTQRRRD